MHSFKKYFMIHFCSVLLFPYISTDLPVPEIYLILRLSNVN